MSLDKAYNPKGHEEKIYEIWEKSGVFAPKNRDSDKNFAMVFPLPNANGNLHLGHALTNAIYDIAIRYRRMKGEAALYLPGADHAGFETQVVYEKQLAKEGKSRFDLTRDELYEQVWDFVEANKHNFETQFRRLGASCDWDHYTYTLDQKIVDRAYATFKKLWDDQLIYRGERLVNYCTFHGTGFADIEVEFKEVNGKIWQLKYPLTDGSGEVTVATTRPETMLGDVAVAVHPEDKRYKHLVGKTVKLPLTHREIPIIADEFVDISFGTGAVKVTPAHDQNDYEVAERHDLPKITVIGFDGKMTHEAPEKYHNLEVKEARKVVVTDLEEQGFLANVKDHKNNVGHCYKCGTVIEPLLKEQWFIDMQPLAKKAIEALKAKEIAFYPDSKRTQLIRYLEGLKDWNISRQIAWGIPIPAFQNAEAPEKWIFDTRVDQKEIEGDGKVYHRDPDVFDTWFSSSSWPYATLDYPDGEDFKQFYPTGLLDTGGEILYPWVSRMIMLGLYVTGDVPFKEVYIHGYVMAEDGSKMSKSLGNVIDPMPVIDEYGSDALRMGIVAGRVPAVNRGYDHRRIEEARNFCNKLWNIARFIETTAPKGSKEAPKPESAADHWMLQRLNKEGSLIGKHLDHYRFAEGYDVLYHLVWDDVADWYIEASKTEPNPGILNHVLETVLKLAHPFAPFISETIWQTLDKTELLITSKWPGAVDFDAKKAGEFAQIQQLVGEVRHIKTLVNYSGGDLYFNKADFVKENSELIKNLAKLNSLKESASKQGVKITGVGADVWFDLNEETAKKLLKSLADREEQLKKSRDNLKTRLANKNYVDKAPKHLIEQTKAQLNEAEKELDLVKAQIDKYQV